MTKRWMVRVERFGPDRYIKKLCRIYLVYRIANASRPDNESNRIYAMYGAFRTRYAAVAMALRLNKEWSLNN